MTYVRGKKRVAGNCKLCGVYRWTLHRDHIIPKFKGGTDDPLNLQYLCANCHEDKTQADSLGQNLAPNRPPLSEEAKQKMRTAPRPAPWNKGKKATDEVRVAMIGHPSRIGRVPWNKGIKGVSDETREQMRLAKEKRFGPVDRTKTKYQRWKERQNKG